jgi:lipoyl(octanoyl) transferase
MAESWRLLTGIPMPDDRINPIQITTPTEADNSQLGQTQGSAPTRDFQYEAAYHMAVDEAMITAYRSAKMPPTLRLYTWQRPSLTIGYFQSIQEELDWSVCQSNKIPVIRRITGGRAVLHGRDLTYSVVAGPSSIFPTKSIQKTFLTISRAFLLSFSYLGLRAEAVASSPKHVKTPLCFASPSWYEIVCEGRKVIGSAQRRWRDAFLQQGSVLIEFNPLDFYRFFRFPTEKHRTMMVRRAGKQAAGLSECARRTVSFQEVQEAMVVGFERALGIVLKPGTLTAQEIEIARYLTLNKYSLDDWNLKRKTPPSSALINP